MDVSQNIWHSRHPPFKCPKEKDHLSEHSYTLPFPTHVWYTFICPLHSIKILFLCWRVLTDLDLQAILVNSKKSMTTDLGRSSFSLTAVSTRLVSFPQDTTSNSEISRSGLSSYCHRVSSATSSLPPARELWTMKRLVASTSLARSLVSSTRLSSHTHIVYIWTNIWVILIHRRFAWRPGLEIYYHHKAFGLWVLQIWDRPYSRLTLRLRCLVRWYPWKVQHCRELWAKPVVRRTSHFPIIVSWRLHRWREPNWNANTAIYDSPHFENL